LGTEHRNPQVFAEYDKFIYVHALIRNSEFIYLSYTTKKLRKK